MIIGPVSPYAEPQEYAGKNLALGESDFVVYDGSVAAGDTLTITSGEVAPTVKADSVTIKSVKVTSDGAESALTVGATTISFTRMTQATRESKNWGSTQTASKRVSNTNP